MPSLSSQVRKSYSHISISHCLTFQKLNVKFLDTSRLKDEFLVKITLNPTVSKERVHDHLRNMNLHESMGPDKITSQSPEGID